MNCSLIPKLKRSLFVILCLFSIQKGFGQISVEPTGSLFTPESLISNVFLGEGVEVLEITHNGTSSSVGYFSNGTNDIGINRGIVMSTGTVNVIAGPNEAGGTSGSTSGNSNDPYLGDISDNLFDNNKYTIRFIPTSDTLRFKYTFASEEYPEYACTGFNDIFGFFIHGPGINGSYPNNAENIALVPELSDPTGLTFTDLPVTINNVNGYNGNPVPNECLPPNGSTAYSQYYRDNVGSENMIFDGYLKVFYAQAIVTPCQEYTIVLSIADVGDDQWDSAVFLEARSFGTGSLQVETQTVSLDGSLSEGCASGELTFALPNVVENDFPIDYTIFGTATNGVDYSFIPDDLFIAAGDSVVSVPVEVYEDNIEEDVELIGIDIQRDPCNRDTFYFRLNDNRLLELDLGVDETICDGNSLQLDGTMDVPLPDPPNFTNTTDYDIVVISDNNPPPPGTPPTISPINVIGVQPLVVQPDVIKSVCINVEHRWISDVDVFLFAPNGQFIELTTDNGKSGDDYFQTCFTPTATNPINFGSQAPSTAAPFTGDWMPEGSFEDLYGSPTNGEWQLAIKIDQQGFSGTLLDWSICFNPVYQIDYNWTPATGLSCTDCPDPVASPNTTTTYTLEVTDTYGCSIADEVEVMVEDAIEPPVVNCTPTTNSIVLDWAALAGATGYEININGSGWQPTSGDLQHLINGLSINEEVSFEIRATSDCDSDILSSSCTTLDCIPPSINLDAATNIDCFNGTNGTINVSATGAMAPYEFNIPGIEINNTGVFTDLPAGSYNVVVTDNLGCPGTMEVTLTEPEELAATIQIVDSITCNGLSNGRLAAIVEGGTGPFDFNWNNSNTDSVFNAGVAGINTVVITDQNNCNITVDFDMPEPEVLTVSASMTVVSCPGGNDGTATALASGGSAPYAYQWSNGQTADEATGFSAGTEFVTVTDAKGCMEILNVSIDENPPIALDFSETLPACNGISNGNVTVLPTGGSGTYTYEWSNNQSSATAAALGAGEHFVTVTDDAGCSITGSYDLGEPDPIIITETVVNPLCAEGDDATISLEVTGGNGGYSFTWTDDNTITTDNRTNLTAGSYTVNVVDQIGCQNSLLIEVVEPASLDVITSTTPVGCAGGNTGAVSASVNGGSGTIIYQWDINGTIVTTPMVENLPAAVYGLTITDGNDCEYTEDVEVFQSAGIDVVETISNVNCFGDNNGSIDLVISGGNAPYTLEWVDENNNVIGDTENIENLVAGTYQINITDANNCIQTNAFEISQQPELVLGFASTTPVSCASGSNGNITLSVEGGDGNYNYQWSNNATTANLENIPADDYEVTVTDGLGCSAIINTTITEPTPIQISGMANPVNCFGETNGSISINVNGGTVLNDYQYVWSHGGNTTLEENLASGDYEVTIFDDNGCSQTAIYSINTPAEITTDTDIIPATCSGSATGTAIVTADGGDGGFTYQWGTNANMQTTATATDLLADVYFVTVTDGNGCTAEAIADVVEPLAISNEIDQTNVDCFGTSSGTITTSIQGGTTPYTYEWNGPNGFASADPGLTNIQAGVYNLIVTDNNSCTFEQTVTITQPTTGLTATATVRDTVCFGLENGSATAMTNGGTGAVDYLWNYQNQTTATVNNLPAGTWEVVATDASGCTATASTIIDENPEITLELDQTPSLCNNGTDGTANLRNIFSGGVAVNTTDYILNWSTNETTANIANLTGGSTYDIAVTDRLGCTATAAIEIGNPAPVGVLTEANNAPSCFGGNDGLAQVSGAGGVAPYQYTWSANADNQSTAAANNLTAGTYFVSVQDANTCETVLEVTVDQPTQLGIDFQVGEISCPGDTDGEILSNISGGTAPYNYNWSTGATTSSINEITAGDYSLTITDNNGCSFEATQAIELPEVLEATTDIESPICFGDQNGRILINPTGGVGPYTYALNEPDYGGSSVQLGITAGFYTIFVKDSKGCEFQDTLTVTQPEAIVVNAGRDQSIQLGDSLQLSAEVTNAVGEVFIDWMAPYEGTLFCQADTVFSCDEPWSIPQHTIKYVVLATDENGCQGADEIEIEVVKARQVMAPTAFTPNGDGNNDLLIIHGVPGTEVLNFKVFDRWGTLLYEDANFMVNDEDHGWNGSYRSQLMATGVYMWMAEVKYIDGAIGTFSGNSTLLR